MISTVVKITPEYQMFLIKEAARRRISVEAVASEILGKGIQAELSYERQDTIAPASQNPLKGLQPYQYNATPEESTFPVEEWNMEQEEDEDVFS